MILGEPPRTQWDLHFVLFGVPVRVHPMFWALALFLGLRSARERPLISMLLWMVAVFLSILVHELGHAIVMRAYGFAPRITLYWLGGLASQEPGVTYSARRLVGAPQILISAAGPAAQFLLAAAIAGVLMLANREIVFLFGFPYGILVGTPYLIAGSEVLTYFVNDLMLISCFWGVLNLWPVYPLDGGQISREILLKWNPREGIRVSLVVSLVAAIGLAVFGATREHWFMVILFGMLAYSSFATLQAYQGRGPRW